MKIHNISYNCYYIGFFSLRRIVQAQALVEKRILSASAKKEKKSIPKLMYY